ncbi:MAG: hypothetical protein ACT4PE_15945 [Candidatus Eiseniibacteriota bacterium]
MKALTTLVAGALIALGSSSASAQTRLTVAGGALIPLGDLENTHDTSAHAAFRIEHQPVDALGRAGRLSFLGEVSWADLSLEPAVEQALEDLGMDGGASLLGVGLALRVYSAAAPLFVHAGSGWARHESDDSDSENGVDVHAGIGFVVTSRLVFVEPLVSAHTVLLEGEDLQFVTATLGVGLPF